MRFLQRKNILHRGLLIGLCLALCAAAAAQRSTRKTKGPRALALVEWPASGGSPRVIPVVILVDGRYYDASIYKADPVPMALEPGNVYEVEQSGESIGMVTLTTARQAKNGAWLADSKFQTNEQLAAARKPREAPKTASKPEGPPKLRRGGHQPGSDKAPAPQPTSAPQPSSTPKSEPGAADEPPVLRKPTSEKTPEANKPGQTTSAEQAPPSSASTPSASKPEDSEHPVLRRGRPTAEQAENLPGAVEVKAAPKTPAAAGPTSRATKAAAAGAGRVLPAISDAAGPEPRSFLLPWKNEDQEKLKASMIQLATTQLQAWARTHGGTHPGALTDVQVRAFDLTASNEPQAVLMARATEAPASPVRRAGAKAAPQQPSSSIGLTYWITVAARQDYNGELRKLKVWATDSKHLDAYPRAELIDAVDADGDGRGDLLFREIYDDGQSFALYRATPDTLTELYNSAELER
jgi:hypothetical protein